ncbi:hypothetical protein L2E82_39162 [Cichorium intybus]|uniref:Uncharacterized protein n=1 Tax=Cichorium intybus TaxID=13427 RepID=A0ACB9AHF6_CICIN|nr:hypothetical protein L2E82_39162 [Cichorium intybus]
MDWARVWIQLIRILNFISNVGDTVILMIATRMIRDSDELRRRTLSRILARGFLIVDMLLTTMFIFLATFVLIKSQHENPQMPLRFWIVGFMLYCMFHLVFLIIQFEGGPWSQEGFMTFRNLEHKKNVFGIFWWALGMFFMAKGDNQMYLAAPELTWIFTFFLCFDIALAMCCTLFLLSMFIMFCGCIPILFAVFYYMRNRQNQRRVQLPPCPWCHK